MIDPKRISYWWDTLPPIQHRPALESGLRTDVVIVGAGYTGLWTAYYLLRNRPDLKIAIVEKEVAGFGASGRNGGWCSALFPASLDAIARQSSREAAIAMQRAMNATVDEVGSVAAAERLDIDWAKSGTLILARTAMQQTRLQAEVAHDHEWGFTDTTWLSGDESRERIAATDVLGGLYTPHCAAIHPAKLVRGLAEVVERMGATIYEDTGATSIEPGIVRTAHGVVHAPYVVRATEGYTRTIDGYRRNLAPVYSLMLATEPLPAALWNHIGVNARETFSDGRHLVIYGQRTADDRIAFGGRGAPYHFGSRIENSYDRHPATHAAIWQALVELFPPLNDVAVTHTWGGPLGIPRDWFASCGLDSNGMAWAGGYVGDGVGTSNLAGRTLADLITGRTTPLTELPWVGHRSPKWEPEPLRWLATNAGRQRQ
jgi:glycine/D-amino acid oxidase-like deaminating enzyme